MALGNENVIRQAYKIAEDKDLQDRPKRAWAG